MTKSILIRRNFLKNSTKIFIFLSTINILFKKNNENNLKLIKNKKLIWYLNEND
jgi:hypothetical protein